MRLSGLIVLPNGSSGSGKSALGKVINRYKKYDFVYLSIDRQIDMTLSSFFQNYGVSNRQVRNDGLGAAIQCMTPVNDLFCAMIWARSNRGVNVVVDCFLKEDEGINQCLDSSESSKSISLGPYCYVEELRRRENARGDGPPRSEESKIHRRRKFLHQAKIDSEIEFRADGAKGVIKSIGTLTAFASMKTIYEGRPT